MPMREPGIAKVGSDIPKDFDGCGQSMVGMVGHQCWDAEDCQDAVAQELVGVTTMTDQDRDDDREQFIEPGDNFRRACAPRRRS